MEALERLPEVLRRRARLSARTQTLQERHKQLTRDVSRAKARVEQSESVQAALIELQRRGHARAVGVFEKLLTSLLRDVFPEERTVHLDLHTERGLPALDLYVQKAGSEPEDADMGVGGAVTNGLSTGLRFIALMRSGRRPFIILDEPDCWMEEQRVPDFTRLIHETATELGIQVLMVSHHTDDLLTAIPYRLRLDQGSEGLEINWSPTSRIPDWELDQEGLRGVLFEHCYGHTSTYLPLAPGVTLLRGSNDAGKSALVSTLKQVLDGNSRDSMIQHHQPRARVTLDFGPHKVVRFERQRSGSPKVRYDLIDPDLGPDASPIRSSTDARRTPDWLLEVTGIGEVDGMDIQLTNQKTPVFLLNAPASQRAKALAIGSENAYVQQMMALDKQEVQEARARIRHGEAELEGIRRELMILDPLNEAPDPSDELEAFAQKWPERHAQREQQRNVLNAWFRTRDHLDILARLEQGTAISTPRLQFRPHWRNLARDWQMADQSQAVLRRLDQSKPIRPAEPPRTPHWKGVLQRWQRLLTLQKMIQNDPGAAAPAQMEGADIRLLLDQMKRALKRYATLSMLTTHPFPTPPNNPGERGTQERKLIEDWKQALHEEEQLEIQENNLLTELSEVEHTLHELRLHMGAEHENCPLCGQELQSQDN